MFKDRHKKILRGRRRYYRINYRLLKIRRMRKFIGPERHMSELGDAVEYRKNRRAEKARRLVIKGVSSKVNLYLFKLTYDILLNYHVPLGKKLGEWKPGIMVTNVLLIRNMMSILDITTIFFELRKIVNRLFKALKLRKGVAVLNGRRYGWRKIFTFVFERWLPGFFTNFRLNINELISYFFKKKCLTRRQKTRILSLKMLNYDMRFFYRPRKKKNKKKLVNLISYLKLPTVSLSLIDSVSWLRECKKQGLATIQLADTNSEVEKIDYPVIANQKSVAFLSFVTLLAKEVAYQARYWELKNFKLNSYYVISDRLKQNNKMYSFFCDIDRWVSKVEKYDFRKSRGYKPRTRFEARADFKLRLRSQLINWEVFLINKSNKI